MVLFRPVHSTDLTSQTLARVCWFLQFKNRREDRERKGSIPFHVGGAKKRQRRMGVPFLLHEDHLEVSPTRSTFSFSSLSGLTDDRRPLERGGWQATIMGKIQQNARWCFMKLFYVLGFLSYQEVSLKGGGAVWSSGCVPLMLE